MPDRLRIRRLAARVARGRRVRWEDEERAAGSDGERAALRELRVLAAMMAFGDASQGPDESASLESGVSLGRSVLAESPAAPVDGPGALPEGARWGHLEIVGLVGRGAFGEVYRARDTRLDRVVALKLLAGEGPAAGDEVVREARLLARVRHPNVVTVHGADRIDGRVGIWMEFVHGATLSRMLRDRGSLDAREAALIGIDLCRALSAVHGAGIAHRDVKLANVMRAEGGRIVLMDFGLGHETSSATGRGARKLSGTPLFIAPEVLRGAPVDARSDLYSLGVVLFALVTGKLPVEASSLSDLRERHARGDVRRARDLRPDLPESFAHVLDRALDPDPSTRLQTAGDAERALLQSLGAAVTPAATDRRGTRSRFALALGLVAAVILGGAAVASWTAFVRRDAAREPRAPYRDTPDQRLVGEKAGALFGLSVEGVGDVDGDGFGELLVAAPYPAGDVARGGTVHLYRGGPRGLELQPSWTYSVEDSGRFLGQSIAPRTDLNLDGYADLVVGAPDPAGFGEVLVFHGSRSGLAANATQVIRGRARQGHFGYAVSTGDINHDGRSDLLVGEPYHPPAASGRAYLFMSRGNSFETTPTWTFTGPESSQFGITVALGGDLDHDGYEDAVIGACTASFGPAGHQNGAAYVFLGTATGLQATPVVVPGRQSEALFGRDVLIARDLDGDGFHDLFVGAESGTNGEQEEGVAEIHFGARGGVSAYGTVLLEPNVVGANFGGHAASLGDVDGDGCDDLFVGALRYQRNEPRAGAAFIFSGSRLRILQRTWLRVGPKGGSWYGADGGPAGDVNGDGFPDLVVAAPSWDAKPGQNTGMVEVFLNTRRR